MFEIMHALGRGPTNNTGPGPSELVGYWTDGNGRETGYFGSITGTIASGWFSNQELVSKIPYSNTVGNVVSGSAVWLKFLLDGKILFMPVSSIANGSYWNNLNFGRLVYGGRNGQPTTEITIADAKFTVRLPRAALTDPAPDSTINNSEWARCMYPIASTVSAEATENGAKWDSIVIPMSATFVPCQETLYGDSTRALGIYYAVASVSRSLKNTPVSSFSWRPVLEWIP